MIIRPEAQDMQWTDAHFWAAVPQPSREPVWQWAEKNFKAVGSPLGEDWRLEYTPWFRDPLEWLNVRSVHSITFVGPAQETGKSAFGEIAVCYCIATRAGGDVQMNWQNDHLSKARYKKRVRRVLMACPPVMALWPVGKFRNDATNGLVAFPHLNFIMQGVQGKGRTESDTIWVQVNEEVHEWEPEILGKADQRLKKVSFPKQLNLSTGGVLNDQLHVKYKAGTMQDVQEQCPGCKEWFTPGVAIHDDRPGGLKYDSKRAKRGQDDYDYEIIASTAYVECPHCAHRMFDDPVERKRRSLAGRLSDPTNTNPDLHHRSIRLSATACYSRPLVEIIKHKHSALRALKYGDIMPWKVYIQREEADFWDPQSRPLAGKITVSSGVKKREGIPDRDYRFMAADRQRGESAKGESSHFWVVIRDWKRMEDGRILTRLVWEGKRHTDEDLDQKRIDYEVEPRFVFVDSGDEAAKVYRMCAKYGYVAIKGEDRPHYPHDIIQDGEVVGKTLKIYAPVQMIDAFHGDHKGEDGRAPQLVRVPFVRYSKQAIRDTLDLIRSADGFVYEIPGDVSMDYRQHWEAESLEEKTHRRTGEKFFIWVQHARRNDLFVCEAYQTLPAAIVGLVGASPTAERPEDVKIETR